jgi:hypothetical protein
MKERIGRTVGGGVIALLALSAAVTGCHRQRRAVSISASQYIVAKSRLVVSQDRAPVADVTDTETYRHNLRAIQRVAVRAPDACANESASAASGAARGTRQVLRTQCGVEMAELERSLAKAGYVVSSWTAIANMVEREHLTPTAAAAKLRAQVLFQVNSLERVARVPAQDARWERGYFVSDPTGAERAPAALLPDDLTSVRALLQRYEARVARREQPGAMIDINAIWVPTEQTIWFYRWSLTTATGATVESRVLAAYTAASRASRRAAATQGGWVEVTPVRPDSGEAEVVPVVSNEVEASSDDARNHDEAVAASAAVLREVVEDFVGRFSGTRTTSSPVTPPAR